MRFDDRLSTVLGLSASGVHERAVQWRQLVELVARGAGRENATLLEEALGRIAVLMREVPEEVRAAAARAIAGPDVPAELVALFASDGVEAAAPVLTAAELDPGGWAAVRAVASPAVAAMVSALRPRPAEPVTAPELPAIGRSGADEAHAHVPPAPNDRGMPYQQALPAGVFRWECGPTGEIDWVEGGPRAGLIGRSLTDDLDRSFADRLPFEDEPLQLAEEGALAGEWRWTGTPAFFPDTGRFAGYRGTARREGEIPEKVTAPMVPLDADSLRELVHELRTPLNAIIGFGEIIDGQYLGPAHRPYRERAASIVRQARRLVEAVEDLDFSARLHSGRAEPRESVCFDVLFPPLRLAMLEQAAANDVTLTISMRAGQERCAVPRDLAERLLRRFLSSVIAGASRGERLELVVDRIGKHLAVAIDRPQAVRGISEEQLLNPAFDAAGDPSLGLGFALRLVRGLANMTGGGLDVAPERLVLLLPITRA